MKPKPGHVSGFAKALPEKRGWPHRHRWLLGTAFLLGVLVSAYFLFQNLIVDTQLRPVIERELTKAVNSPVSIQSIKAGLTGNVVLNHVILTIPGSPWETHLTVDRISVNLELFNLLFHRKALENCFESLSFIRPKIYLVRVEPTPIPSGPTTTSLPASSEAKPPLPFIPVPKIIVQQGSFFVQADKTPRAIVNGLNFEASTVNGATWGLLLQAHSPEANSLGEVRFNGSLRLENLKVSGKVLLQRWPLVSLHTVLKELAGWELLSGTIDAESPVVFQPGHGLWFDAKTNLSQASVKSPLPTAITLSQITGRAFIRPTEINVPGEMLFSLGETGWRASGLIPFDGRPLAVRTMTDQLFLSSVFTEILKLKNLKVDGKGTATLAVAGPMSNPVIQGAAQLGPSHVGQGSLDSLTVKAGYEKGNFKLYEAKGKLYDGDFEANGFMSLSGEKDAPVSLKAILKNIEAKKLAADLGISGMEGRGDVEAHVTGSLDKPILSAVSQMTLSRTLREAIFHYGVHTNLQLTEQKLTLSAVIDEKARLETEFLATSDAWEMQKFTFSTGKKSGKLTGKGKWPKAEDGPIDIQIHGNDIALEDLPFLNDQFPDITGRVHLDARLNGTRKEPKASVHFSSPEVQLGDLDPEPLDLSLSWKPGEFLFEKLTVGDIFSTTGRMGLTPDSELDLKIQAQGVPIRVIAEISNWNNPPQPFEGWVTGRLHFAGLRKNPIIEGNGLITSLKVGDWTADQVDALLSLDQGKLQIKKVKLTQGTHSLTATGSWDTRVEPGIMNLQFVAREFQLGKGPYLSGDFFWQAKTGDPWWKNWNGTFTSASIALKDLKKNTYHFNDFSMVATSEDFVIKGKVKVGKTMSGSATLDLSSDPAKMQALLKIEPVPLAQAPELIQFLPASLKATGKISGQIVLRNGTFADLPMTGTFIVTDGTIQKYDFDRMEFAYNGNKSKITPSFTLIRDQAKYSLTGTLESPKAFWDSDSKITINGPFQKEKLQNLLALFGINTEKHKITGQVDGNLTVSGSLTNPTVGFAVTGENLQYDGYLVPSAELHFSETGGRFYLEKNQITLTKGLINIEKGSAQMDPDDSTVWVIDLAGSTQSVPIAVFDLTSQIHMAGRLALEEKEGRPTFDGMISYLDKRQVIKQEIKKGDKGPTPFDLAIQVHKKSIDFKPLGNDEAQLVGRLDISQDQKIIFQNIHLEHSQGSFSVDGTLDMNGNSQFVSDAKNIPIETVGKFLLPKFPLSGTGSYHLIFDGTLDSPVFTTSISIANGKVGDLQFDLLDGELTSKNNTLSLGSKESPLTLSRKGVFSFNVWGKAPLALTKTGWLKVRDREMDISAEMDKGDFGLILLAGLAEKASGEMDFSAHVGGALDNPVLTMDLDLNHCQMIPNLVAHSIEDISGRIKVRNNHLAVEDLNGRIGQGRVFISSPPIEESKMVLENFIPNYLDFRVRTVGDHGLLLSIPTIMKPGEWGEIYFYGDNPAVPMLIRGSLQEPHVIGTAFLETGHYTFPPEEAKDKNGEKIEYRELAGVFFELKLKAGRNTWYSNEFNSNYLELKVDQGDEFMIEGKDADRTPQDPGIKCHGTAGSKEGYLRYLGHRFTLQEASLYIPKGKSPNMQGRAVDRLHDVDLVASGGSIRKTDVDVWVDFKGPFGNINFNLDSSPRFHPDLEAHKTILLSYIMFGRDMTNYTYSKEQLQTAYESKIGKAATDAAVDYIDRMISYTATRLGRPFFNQLGNLEFNVETNLAGKNGTGPVPAPTAAISQVVDANGNTVGGSGTVSLAKVSFTKHLSQKLFVSTTLDINRNLQTDSPGVQPSIGLGYNFNKNLSLGVTQGTSLSGLPETKVGVAFSESLPDIMGPKKGDKEKPHFERFDIYPIAFGKFQLNWETDKVTKCEVKVFDSGDQLVQDIVEKGQHDYNHQMVIENLNPEMGYKIRISAKDLNENEMIKEQKVSPSAGQVDSP